MHQGSLHCHFYYYLADYHVCCSSVILYRGLQALEKEIKVDFKHIRTRVHTHTHTLESTLT